MDLSALLPHVATLTVDDRLRLVQTVLGTLGVEERNRLAQAIWESVAADQAHPELTEGQERELERRIADLDAHPENVLTWVEIHRRQVRE